MNLSFTGLLSEEELVLEPCRFGGNGFLWDFEDYRDGGLENLHATVYKLLWGSLVGRYGFVQKNIHPPN